MTETRAVHFGCDNSLLGIYHAATGHSLGHGVLICPPLLDECARGHWLLRQIGLALASKGYDVLRFDFTGMGNSQGNVTGCKVDTWQADIEAALATLKKQAGTDIQVSAIASRYTCALLARLNGGQKFTRVCVWDPLESSRDWLQELESGRVEVMEKSPCAGFTPYEYSGHNLGEDLVAELNGDIRGSVRDIPAADLFAVVAPDFAVQLLPDDINIHQLSSEYTWSFSDTRMLYLTELLEVVGQRF